ncbi:MAG: hypothetical protein LBV67_03390 [Streptococcaceae bacterium]|jgi:hypothetical protein|nr:hypothetical protein [Streptococcaceae bacterium]
MLFNKYQDNYILNEERFLRVKKVMIGSINTIRIGNKIIPPSASSSDSSKLTCLNKMYNEYLERSHIGFMMDKEDKLTCIDLISSEKHRQKKKNLSYGNNNVFGYIDSTGTASRGESSQLVVKKAIAELLEKNELFLFWYFNLGKRMPSQDDCVKKYIKLYAMESYDNFVFKVRNLSNWFTIIFISFKGEKLISTGICCHENIENAIEGAVKEAKILRVLNSFRYMEQYSGDFQKKIFAFIHSFKGIEEKFKPGIALTNYNLLLNDMVKDLNVAFINSNHNNKGKVISVFSTSLIKCLPIKKNLTSCKNVPIVNKYGLLNIDDYIDCIVD